MTNEQDAVLVVGGGIGGLVLARALAKLGISVVVLERAESLRAIGAGITLGANAMRVLQQLGLGPAVAATGRALGVAAITDARGRVLAKSDIAALEARFGKGYAIHRGALHDVLARDLERAGAHEGAEVTVRCGVTTAAIEFDDRSCATVFLTDGTVLRPRAVIGADGLHSSVRAQIIGEHPPRYAGYTCWRWTGTVAGGIDGVVEMWGRGLRAGLVPLPGDEVYAFLVANAEPGTPRDPQARRVTVVRERFAGFGGDMPRVLAAIPDDGALLHHDIDEIELPSWCRGNVGLLGDAAHAMTPNFGQGAAMAIEDAIVLARELAAHKGAAAALRAYEARRRPRVEALQQSSRRLGTVAQWSSPVATWARDLAMRLAPASTSERALETIVSHVP